MQSFTHYIESTITEGSELELDVLGVIKTFNGSSPVEIEVDHISTMVPTMDQVDQIIDSLPTDLDYEVLVHSVNDDFDSQLLSSSDDMDDDEYEIDEVSIPDDFNVQYQLIIYTYNTSMDEQLDEIKRSVKINSKGQRRIKMQCKKGFKYDGKKCVKISGKELVAKRRAIRKAVRTKKGKGSGYLNRVIRLRKRANNKRKSMGMK